MKFLQYLNKLIKHSGFDCKYCYINIPYANKFIMDLNIEIREQKNTEQKQKQKENEEKKQTKNNGGKKDKKNTNEKEIMNNQNINLNDTNTEVNRDHFVLNRVRGDGNCTLIAILKSAGIDENHHLIRRKALTNICKRNKFRRRNIKRTWLRK